MDVKELKQVVETAEENIRTILQQCQKTLKENDAQLSVAPVLVPTTKDDPCGVYVSLHVSITQ